MTDLWKSLAADASVTLTDDQIALFHRYLDLLIQANRTMNLTRIVDRRQAELHHIADSLTVLPFLPNGPHALVDLGAGGGVPGIPLAIARPDATLLLIESTKKKAAFLRATIANLGLANVTVTDQRAEDVAQSDLRETFDIATARAVAALPWLIEWALPLLNQSGKLLAMKGMKVQEEIPQSARAIKLLHATDPIVHPIALPETEHHVIVEIGKTRKSDPIYPRRPTATKGKPL